MRCDRIAAFMNACGTPNTTPNTSKAPRPDDAKLTSDKLFIAAATAL